MKVDRADLDKLEIYMCKYGQTTIVEHSNSGKKVQAIRKSKPMTVWLIGPNLASNVFSVIHDGPGFQLIRASESALNYGNFGV